MNETERLQQVARVAAQGHIDRGKKLKEGIEKVKAKRQEQTGKHHHQQ